MTSPDHEAMSEAAPAAADAAELARRELIAATITAGLVSGRGAFVDGTKAARIFREVLAAIYGEAAPQNR